MSTVPLEGTYIEDTHSIEIGSGELSFKPISIATSESEDCIMKADWALFDGALLSIVFLREDKQEYLGSAAMVAPGIAISAMHIYAAYENDIKEQKINIVGVTASSKGVLEFWKCWGIVEIKSTDLCVLSFDLACPVRGSRDYSIMPLTTRVPEVGEKVKGIGFRASQSKFITKNDGSNTLSGDVLVAAGTVTDVHLKFRDKFLMPYPVFKFESSAKGGMSGGPVLDTDGYMIGMISLSNELEEGANLGYSYASMMHRALCADYCGGWRCLSQLRSEGKLLGLANKFCEIEKVEKIRCSQEEKMELDVWTSRS